MLNLRKSVLDALLTLLIIIDVIAILILGVWYYFGFSVSWGLKGEALTWGFPVLACLFIICIFLVMTIKHRKFSFGFISLGIFVLIALYIGVLKYYFDPLTLPKQNNTPEYVDSEENRITEVILENLFGGGRYTIVYPDTESSWTGQDGIWLKKNITIESGSSDFDYRLLDRFIEVNQSPVQLSLASSPQSGYWIDYDSDFQRYFNHMWGGGWWGKRLAHPMSMGMTEISRPVYDASSGYGVISVGSQYDWLFGSGYVILFKYENGNFTIVGRARTWES